MASTSADSYSKAVSTTTIVIVVVVIVLGLAFCIGCTIAIVCIIKHLNRPRGLITNGVVLQPNPSYPNSVPNYPAPHPLYPNNGPNGQIVYPSLEKAHSSFELDLTKLPVN